VPGEETDVEMEVAEEETGVEVESQSDTESVSVSMSVSELKPQSESELEAEVTPLVPLDESSPGGTLSSAVCKAVRNGSKSRFLMLRYSSSDSNLSTVCVSTPVGI